MDFSPVYSLSLSDAKIRQIFCTSRFENRISCSQCHKYRIKRLANDFYRCLNCWSYFSITTKTWIHRTRKPLRFWYEISWCFILSHSAHKASLLLKNSHRECWLAYQTIRKTITSDSLLNRPNFTGTIEIDESYYGGSFKNLRKQVRAAYRAAGLAKRGRGAKYRKQPVFGIFKRNGKVYLEPVNDTTGKQLLPPIKQVVDKGSEICSDELPTYAKLVGLGYIHHVVNHGQEQYVVGDYHINGLEGFWGLSKTNMHTYKGIRKSNWLLYLKEMEWRYNHRQQNFEDQVLLIIKLLMSNSIQMSHRKEAPRY